MIPTNKKYQIIYADPPWDYQDSGFTGGIKHHYKGLHITDICGLPIRDIKDKNCVLFLWATYPMIREAFLVIDSWGFNYKSIAFQWIKIRKDGEPLIGMGRWTRGNTEPCFLAVSGSPKRIAKNISQIIQYPRGKHSAKPPIVRDRILQLMGDLPRIELFARDKVDGWDTWMGRDKE